VIPMPSQEPEKHAQNFLEQAKEAEARQDFKSAEKLYKQHLNEHRIDEYAYNRLMVIYRKQKMYKDELAIINRAIKALEDFYTKRAQKRVGKNNKIKTLSNNLIKSLGLADKKGNALYEPEPLPTWKKRKAVVSKKLHK
jgi:tetratricopeptide (TPR) repeat protein